MQHIVGDEDVGRDPRDELLARHDLAGELGETNEHLHHFGLDADDFGAAAEPVDGGLDRPFPDQESPDIVSSIEGVTPPNCWRNPLDPPPGRLLFLQGGSSVVRTALE
jgi:hypothetical protein